MAIEITNIANGSIGTTSATINLPAYTADDYLILFTSRNQATAISFGSNVTATTLSAVSGRLEANLVVPNTSGETSFDITYGNSVGSWFLAKCSGVDLSATVDSSSWPIGTNPGSTLELPDTALSYTSVGTEIAFYVGGVNSTAIWTTDSNTIFNTTSGNGAMIVGAKAVMAGKTLLTYDGLDYDRGLDGTNRLESSITFVLQASSPSSPVKIFNGSTWVDATVNVI